MATSPPIAVYPPQASHLTTLGYVTDSSHIFHSRDIGRPFSLSDNTYLLFGDTFCNDAQHNFVGLAHNTVALVPDPGQNPLQCTYLEVEENGFVRPFIELDPEERELGGGNGQGGRVVLWAFGGVVVMNEGTRRVWYQKCVDRGLGNLEYCGTGIATVVEGAGADRQPVAVREAGLLFGPDEPRMGTFTAVAEGGFIYLYGDRLDGKIILARVPNDTQSPLRKDLHTYWDGTEWVQDWQSAAVVIESMQQGAITRSRLFGGERPFLFVGTSKWADSQVYMGASARLEGPWEIRAVCGVDGINEPISKGKWMYCIYPHLWASDEEKAELMVTWSEQWPGGVVAGRIELVGVGGEDRVGV